MKKLQCSHHLTQKNHKSNYSLLGDGGIQAINGKIYWHIENFPRDFYKYKTIIAFEKAFSLWEDLLFPIRFVAVGRKDIDKAHIKIRFANNETKDLPEPFAEETLGYAYAPHNGPLAGTMWMNDKYDWGEANDTDRMDLLKVITHEVSHLLGLDHSTFMEDITYPYYNPDNKIHFTQDTKDGIEFLYGDQKRILSPPSPYQSPREIIRRILNEDRDVKKMDKDSLEIIANMLNLKPRRWRRQIAEQIINELNKE